MKLPNCSSGVKNVCCVKALRVTLHASLPSTSWLCSLSLCNRGAVPHLTLEGALDWILSMIIRVLEKEKPWLVWRILKEQIAAPFA